MWRGKQHYFFTDEYNTLWERLLHICLMSALPPTILATILHRTMLIIGWLAMLFFYSSENNAPGLYANKGEEASGLFRSLLVISMGNMETLTQHPTLCWSSQWWCVHGPLCWLRVPNQSTTAFWLLPHCWQPTLWHSFMRNGVTVTFWQSGWTKHKYWVIHSCSTVFLFRLWAPRRYICSLKRRSSLSLRRSRSCCCNSLSWSFPFTTDREVLCVLPGSQRNMKFQTHFGSPHPEPVHQPKRYSTFRRAAPNYGKFLYFIFCWKDYK